MRRPMEIRIDSRQVAPGIAARAWCRKRSPPNRPIRRSAKAASISRTTGSFRKSIVWEFNRLYWQRVKDWEKATGKGYEQALPGGKSTGTDEAGIQESVEEFWRLLKDLETPAGCRRNFSFWKSAWGWARTPACGSTVLRPRSVARHEFLSSACDFCWATIPWQTLEHSRPAVKKHLDLCSFIALDATDPIKTLSFLRHKILHVHSTNMYDNLPDEEIVWRDNRIFWVQVARLPAGRGCRAESARPPACHSPTYRAMVDRLLDVGIAALPDRAKGMQFWMEIWRAMRIEEKLVDAVDLPDASFPAGLSALHMEEILRYAPNDLRIHLSTGALE